MEVVRLRCRPSGYSELSGKELVHDLGTASQFGHDHLPVDLLGRHSALVPDEVGDVLKGLPSELSRDTNVCRSSRGTQPVPRPAASVIFLNSRRTLW